MKKLFLSLFILIAATTVATAQGQGGASQAERMAERQAQAKQMLKDSVGLTDEQAQIVLDIQVEFRPKMMEVRNLAEADRLAKMQEINTEMNKRLASALKDGALARKVIEFNSRRRGAGGQRPPGGGNN